MKGAPHILILPMYYPEKDSSPHRGYMFYEQATQIARSGCRTGLAFTEQRPLNRLSWRRFCKESHFQISTEKNDLFTIHRMHAWNPKLSTKAGGLIWCLLTQQLVKNYIRRYGKPDLIHAHFGQWAGYAAARIKRIYGIDYIVTEHASSINGASVSESQAAILRKAYSGASAVLCVGSMLAGNLKKYCADPSKIAVLPNFVDTSTFRPGTHVAQKEQAFRFISVGNLTPRKGFADLIGAFAQTFADTPHVTLEIAGDGAEKERLQSLIHTYGMSDRITLMGNLSREALSEKLRECDAFALASYGETFGIVFIEAMATGMPAIGTVCGGPEDIITPESGFLIEPGDTAELSQKLRELYDTYERFDRKEISRYIAEHFDFSLAGPALRDIYLRIIREKEERQRM
ncbi:MAG: glycosyltransferase family 4 protein [Bacteroidales bacterium]